MLDPMLTQPRYRHLLTALAIQVACVSFAHAYEQGSYFVFDLVNSKEVMPIEGRIAVLAEALNAVTTETVTTEEVERSEFEIDFSKTMQPDSTISSTFQIDVLTETDTTEVETTSFGTESFDFGTTNTVFGE